MQAILHTDVIATVDSPKWQPTLVYESIKEKQSGAGGTSCQLALHQQVRQGGLGGRLTNSPAEYTVAWWWKRGTTHAFQAGSVPSTAGVTEGETNLSGPNQVAKSQQQATMEMPDPTEFDGKYAWALLEVMLQIFLLWDEGGYSSAPCCWDRWGLSGNSSVSCIICRVHHWVQVLPLILLHLPLSWSLSFGWCEMERHVPEDKAHALVSQGKCCCCH